MSIHKVTTTVRQVGAGRLRRLAAVLVVGTVILGASACGGSGDGDEAARSSDPTSETSAATSAESTTPRPPVPASVNRDDLCSLIDSAQLDAVFGPKWDADGFPTARNQLGYAGCIWLRTSVSVSGSGSPSVAHYFDGRERYASFVNGTGPDKGSHFGPRQDLLIGDQAAMFGDWLITVLVGDDLYTFNFELTDPGPEASMRWRDLIIDVMS